MYLRIVLAFLLLVGLAGVAQSSEPFIGWFTGYPAIDVGMGELPKSGATCIDSIGGGFSSVTAEGKYDFSGLDKQIGYAETHGLTTALICEVNPFFTPAWLQAKIKAAGEYGRTASGSEGVMPSAFSPILNREQEELIRRSVEYVKQRDTKRVVTHYHPGAEWWFPINDRYSPLAITRFRDWLKRRYVPIGRLNSSWQSKYASFDAVQPPKIEFQSGETGTSDLGSVLSVDAGSQQCSWSTGSASDPKSVAGPTTFPAVTPGKVYEFSAWIRGKDLLGAGGYLELAWVGSSGGAPVIINLSKAVKGTGDWRRISMTAKAPDGSARAWLLLVANGTGTAWFDDVDFREKGTHVNLAPNPTLESGGSAPATWTFQNWSGGKSAVTEWTKDGRNAGRALRITVPVKDTGPAGYGNIRAAVHDWCTFWNEAAAQYIDGLAAIYKRLDPSRKTATYLSMSFAYPAEWDFTQQCAIAPDELAMHGKHVDVVGMQICSADGDPYRVTACLDLVRKYNKEMWAVDLVDFTSGVRIGVDRMEKVTQSAVQHGAKGIIYCAWHIPWVLDYSFHPTYSMPDLNRMLTDARTGVKLVDGMRAAPKVALVQPIMPVSPADPKGMKNDFRSFMGWYKILESTHQTFDVVTLREIEEGSVDLSTYRWLLVPDCAHIPAGSFARLSSYSRKGGTIVTSSRFADCDEGGRPFSRTQRLRCKAERLPDYGLLYTGGELIRDTHAGNTPPLFLWRKDTPALTKVRDAAMSKLTSLLRRKGITPSITITGEGIRCVEYAAPGRRTDYLVNLADVPQRSACISWTATARRVEVYADMRRVECPVMRRGGKTEVLLPEFRVSCVVRSDR